MASVTHSLIKAIPTPYGGTIFRSRLEARWALFFDQLGIKWEYEMLGFKLRRPTWKKRTISYIPDFHLPDDDVWVEVKRDLNTVDDAEWKRIHQRCELVAEKTRRPIVLCPGIPDHLAYLTFRQSCPYARNCDACELDASACDEYGNSSAVFLRRGVLWGPDLADYKEDDGVIRLPENEWKAVDEAIAAASSYNFSQVPFPEDMAWVS